MAAIPGFPARTGRTDFGPAKVDEKRTRDPRSEFNGAQAELLFHQVGAMGLLAPQAVVLFQGTTDDVLFAVSTWDQVIYSVEPPWLNASRIGLGDYRFVFDANVTNIDGATQGLVIQSALAEAMGVPTRALTNRRATADLVAQNPAQVDVEVRTAVGVLIDQPVVLVVF